MRRAFLTILLIISAVSCQSVPKNEVSMYDVSSEMKYNEQEKAQKEAMQSAPPMKRKDYSPAEAVIIAGFGITGFASQIAYVKMEEKRRIEAGFYASNIVPGNDPFMIEAEVALPETRKLSLCVINLNCSETIIKTDTNDGMFFSIDLPGLGE